MWVGWIASEMLCDVIGFINIVDTLKKANFVDVLLFSRFEGAQKKQQQQHTESLTSFYWNSAINCNTEKYTPHISNAELKIWRRFFFSRYTIFSCSSRNQRTFSVVCFNAQMASARRYEERRCKQTISIFYNPWQQMANERYSQAYSKTSSIH